MLDYLLLKSSRSKVLSQEINLLLSFSIITYS